MGWRGRRRWPGNGPFRDLPPWQRPGWRYGNTGYDRDSGYTVDPTRCARFPELPRWWWANPDFNPQAPNTDTANVAPVYPPAANPEQEKALLQQELDMINKEMEAIRNRLQELNKEE